jgi:hypothetical protein
MNEKLINRSQQVAKKIFRKGTHEVFDAPEGDWRKAMR